MIWGVVYTVTLIPFALFFLLQSLGEVLVGGSPWSSLLSADNLQTFDVLLFPFFIALFVAAIVLHRRDRNAATPRRPLFGVPLPAWVVVCVVALTVVAASRDATANMPAYQKRDLAATGCANFLREGSIPGAANYYIVVYDRICDRAPKHTVNVSVLDSVGMMPVGPGNALVVEATDSSYESAQKLMVFTHVLPSRGELDIVYDSPARVLSHNSSVHGLTVSIGADSSRNAIRPNLPR